MVDFYFQGQAAEELLAMMSRMEFHNSWLSMKQPLASVSFEAGDWPVCEGGYVEWNLRVYASPEAEWVDRSVEYPDIAGFPYFREWRRVCLKDRGTKEEELSEESRGFHSMQNEGIIVISRLPFEIEDILCISGGAEGRNVDRGNGKSQTYKLISDVYEVTEENPDSNYATVMHVSEDFTAQYEGTLYILSRNLETGEVKIMNACDDPRNAMAVMYRNAQLFLETKEISDAQKRRDAIRETYEEVCRFMRYYHGLAKKTERS